MASASSIAAAIASKTKTKKKHFVAQKVKLFRASDPLLSVLMWGVNHSINELSHVQIPIMLMPDDFKAYSKIKVDNHLFNKENMPSHFKFKEYCPLVFRNLREKFGIDDQDFLNSLTRSAPLNSDAQGRSGARFHTSYDKRYVIKTISSEDVAEMHNILKKYHQFIVECHGNTVLPQFLGIYRLTVDGDETYMIVTRNVFSHRLAVFKKYDLKGSTVAREASDKEKQPPQPEDVPPRPKSGNVQQRLQTLRIATRFYCAMKHVRDCGIYFIKLGCFLETSPVPTRTFHVFNGTSSFSMDLPDALKKLPKRLNKNAECRVFNGTERYIYVLPRT
ncbi:phosphatidylinositol 5-phosphate 4-kinase type-2 alpha isoform X4 [Pseudoliparis swirei]|uniref:phosphatidylinositol 5-phosphate 4-kinase type-2 alpha isoform X4 n=1 Tax=Pseudoliparis swirei TaxID=2059687 RepID=UPI0024BEA77A|nr:phosphatidylinositol 5-phosphate 4-kinase type-2 alpha isoform X4 [Pseudoliparis swirei]